jgi:hypothetical protein
MELRKSKMLFSRNGNFFRVVRITGPAHNLLGMAFSYGGEPAPHVRNIDTARDKLVKLAAEDVIANVLAGVDYANAELGLRLQVSAIEYVASDTPPADIYRVLAYELIRRFRDCEELKKLMPQGGAS